LYFTRASAAPYTRRIKIIYNFKKDLQLWNIQLKDAVVSCKDGTACMAIAYIINPIVVVVDNEGVKVNKKDGKIKKVPMQPNLISV